MKKVLIVSPVECYPSLSGNSARIRTFYEKLVGLGFDVSYLHLPERAFDPNVMIEKLGLNYHYRPYRYLSTSRIKLVFKALKSIVFRKNKRDIKIDDLMSFEDISLYKKCVINIKPDFILINYAYYSRFFESTPIDAVKILDTHDSMFLRFGKIYNFDKGFKNLSVSVDDEINCLNRADHVICIQQSEADFFKQQGCKADIVTIGHDLHFKGAEYRTNRIRVGYIATDYHVNIQAIEYFIDHIWTVLKADKKNKLELIIAGKVCNALRDYSPELQVVKKGIVDSIDQFYHEIDIAINPVQAGSGLKIKCIEPLSFGKPVITTEVGAEGLETFIDKGLIVLDVQYEESWITTINTLISDDKSYEKIIGEIEPTLEEYNSINKRSLYKLFDI